MRRSLRIAMAVGLIVVGLIGTSVAGLAGWYAVDRTAMIGGVCRAGLPNLSRPGVIDAEVLGCTVLSPKRRVTGYLTTQFENSTLFIGEPVWAETGDHYTNETAWFSGTHGVAQRGEEALQSALKRRPGLCGATLAKITVEGWMTVSPGGFGHLNLSEREFYANRILSARAPTEAELWFFQRDDTASVSAPAGTEDYCLKAERGEGL